MHSTYQTQCQKIFTDQKRSSIQKKDDLPIGSKLEMG